MNVWTALLSSIPALAIMGAVFMFATRSIVREEISKLNGTYLRKELADHEFADVRREIQYLRDLRVSPSRGGK